MNFSREGGPPGRDAAVGAAVHWVSDLALFCSRQFVRSLAHSLVRSFVRVRFKLLDDDPEPFAAQLPARTEAELFAVTPFAVAIYILTRRRALGILLNVWFTPLAGDTHHEHR